MMCGELVFADGGTAGSVAGGPGLVGSRVVRGLLDQVRVARAWAREVAAGAGADPDEAELIMGELVANAVVHTRSGSPGGLVRMAVTAGEGAVVLHVHDEGAGRGPAGCLAGFSRRAARFLSLGRGPDGELGESGRGLLIVGALGSGSGQCPADGCLVCPGVRGGRCTWVLMPRREAAGRGAAGLVPVQLGSPDPVSPAASVSSGADAL